MESWGQPPPSNPTARATNPLTFACVASPGPASHHRAFDKPGGQEAVPAERGESSFSKTSPCTLALERAKQPLSGIGPCTVPVKRDEQSESNVLPMLPAKRPGLVQQNHSFRDISPCTLPAKGDEQSGSASTPLMLPAKRAGDSFSEITPCALPVENGERSVGKIPPCPVPVLTSGQSSRRATDHAERAKPRFSEITECALPTARPAPTRMTSRDYALPSFCETTMCPLPAGRAAPLLTEFRDYAVPVASARPSFSEISACGPASVQVRGQDPASFPAHRRARGAAAPRPEQSLHAGPHPRVPARRGPHAERGMHAGLYPYGGDGDATPSAAHAATNMHIDARQHARAGDGGYAEHDMYTGRRRSARASECSDAEHDSHTGQQHGTRAGNGAHAEHSMRTGPCASHVTSTSSGASTEASSPTSDASQPSHHVSHRVDAAIKAAAHVGGPPSTSGTRPGHVALHPAIANLKVALQLVNDRVPSARPFLSGAYQVPGMVGPVQTDSGVPAVHGPDFLPGFETGRPHFAGPAAFSGGRSSRGQCPAPAGSNGHLPSNGADRHRSQGPKGCNTEIAPFDAPELATPISRQLSGRTPNRGQASRLQMQDALCSGPDANPGGLVSGLLGVRGGEFAGPGGSQAIATRHPGVPDGPDLQARSERSRLMW
jgi:hypothetical protein